MRFPELGVTIFAAACVASCTIPDQRDVTGVDLVGIVDSIRCETRDALQPHRVAKGGRDHAIAFGFDFNTEQNRNLSGGGVLTWPLVHGTFAVGFDAGLKRKQYGEEKVTVAETFTELQDLQCDRIRSLRALSYPIVGTIGMEDVITKYLEIVAIPTASVKDYSRTLRFTLKMNVGGLVEWRLIPVHRKLNADIDVAADRQDFHEVKIAISPVRNKTAAELLEDKTVYVRILGNIPDGAPLLKRDGGGRIDGPGIVLPSAKALAKQRVIDEVRDGRINDTYKQIERQLSPSR